MHIVEAGDTDYIVGEQAARLELLDENDKVNAAGKIPATYENVLLVKNRFREVASHKSGFVITCDETGMFSEVIDLAESPRIE